MKIKKNQHLKVFSEKGKGIDLFGPAQAGTAQSEGAVSPRTEAGQPRSGLVRRSLAGLHKGPRGSLKSTRGPMSLFM
jgi:hypothetical protein